jgi:hypothetical protein
MEKLFSVDGQYYVACKDVEMRMSHWIHTPIICTAEGQPIFDLSDSSWSAEEIEWQPDRNQVQFKLRCYPETKPAITVYLDPASGYCILFENELVRNMPLDKALTYLQALEN